MAKTKVLIADDHAVLREGMSRLLSQEKDIEVIGEAGDGQEAVDMVAQLKPDVVLMDIVMPRLTGVEATKLIKKNNPSTCILILTAYSDIRYILGLLEAGASGYLLKSAKSDEIVGAIRAIKAGESVLDSVATRKLLERVVNVSKESDEDKVRGQLSPREIEILQLASKGLSNREIADKLTLSMRTVKAHLSNIFNKMRCSCRTEAIVKGFREGYVMLEDVPQGIDGYDRNTL
ncbi:MULTISPECIES: response regulator transcription factor [Dehalococcoides]|jgi:DNA-binding NarL/FixJ family response regulator|uniref:LuxR family DNA-binding response regulator n=2 Tax=Dehalococcoides mccartyi TaxID=61435 RepID=A0A142V983_9CHLR|nr:MULTISPECIES: response regulator transcription factor [Dehalococcoides]AGG06072.1 signal transduction response regulator, LuxR family [Dehalococcoides mccartyi DCMB5]AGG07504.1 signal transduction response regulator, LuxR family [Dehalococcoides mccartyi BTF08]AII60535.1 chemotaxis protein CheY [Dehalococcoides mccartyi CG5]AMU86199.1 LuxR family DNA-binding response regulator [Dehalococcoides mccartyi]AOV99038.1 DNA-binding response regulator, LuxR family [Dehalococcoides mccartyi]